METSKFGYWLQVGANVGILAGIMLVLVQIQQSNQFTSAQLFSDNVESTITRDLTLLGETPDASMARLLLDPDAATPRDYFVADRLYSSILRQLNRAALLSEVGLYGTGANINAAGFIRFNHSLFACPYGLAWLDELLSTIPVGGPYYDGLSHLKSLASDRLANERLGDIEARAREISRQLNSLKGQEAID